MAKLNEIEQSGNEKENVLYWNDFYKNFNIQKESTFCTFIKSQINEDVTILDIGCGSGRDTYSFARDGFEVVGIDRSEEAIRLNRYRKEDSGWNALNIQFYTCDISDAPTLQQIIKERSERAQASNKKLVIYLRFLLHSINEATEKILLSTLSDALQMGDYLAAEFRTIEDQDREKIYDNHYRRFIVAEDLLSDLENKYNFTRRYFAKGTGFSIFNNEDPYLARIVMSKN